MPVKWAETWENTKSDFKDATNSKKPDLKKIGGIFSLHKSDVTSCLKKAEAAYDAYDLSVTRFEGDKVEEKVVHENLNAFGRAVDTFQGAKKKYVVAVQAAVTKEIKDQGDKTLYSKSCKLLEKTLDSIEAEIEKTQTSVYSRFSTSLKTKQGNLGKAERLEANNINIMPGLVAGAKKAITFVAACKVQLDKSLPDLSPAILFYNNNVQKAARDVSQSLGNAEKMLKLQVPRPSLAFFVARNGGTFKLPANTTPANYVAELKDFANHSKAVETWAAQNK